MVKALPRDEPAQAFAVVRLIQLHKAGTPQYRIQGLSTGLERFAREVEIDALEGGPRP